MGLFTSNKPTPSRCILPLKYVNIRCSRSLSHCRGQGLQGFVKRLEAGEACAIPAHCFARCLNVFARSTRHCSIIRHSLDVVHDNYKQTHKQLSKSRPSFQPNVKTIITKSPWFEASLSNQIDYTYRYHQVSPRELRSTSRSIR